MSLSSDDTPTGPIVGARHAPPGPPAPEARSEAQPAEPIARQRNLRRDLLAGALLVAALLVPWNLYFGFRIPNSSGVLWAILDSVTVLSLLSLLASHRRPGPNGRLRLALNVPYLLLVVGFVLFAAFEFIRSGAAARVLGGVGPGAWLGVAGAVLAAQPLLVRPTVDEESYHRWLRAARLVGYASMFGVSLSSGFTLCWRVRYALPTTGSESFGVRNTTVILTAVVYGAVALAAVLVASRWILRNTPASRLATVALGGSALVAGLVVWVLPVGRYIDAFHGIAQNTPTTGVGYEGYLAWAAAAALFLPLTLFGSPLVRKDRDVWRDALRLALMLIVVWCAGSVLMRISDLVVAVLLNYPTFPYNHLILAAFDAATAFVAWWAWARLGRGAFSPWTTFLSGLVFTLTASRVILGVILAPRFVQGAAPNPVYGNNLVQQMTSTFDVTLVALALWIFPAVIIAGVIRKPRRRPRRRQPAPRAAAGQQRPQVPVPTRAGGPPPPSEARTTQFSVAHTEHDAPTTVLSGPGRAPRIFRSAETTGPLRPKIYRPPNRPS
ncbi:hypothetical protein A5635_16200 [Mycobacterium asiaticum]|uniref:DUF7937 domain-containing protein n=1 Tax=Mycobacterium asiaticum TaxID=1790 RepID=A0A1A3NSQ8_MYCAS|nr:hypothetical protein A5635_16200 [Mycobacterium asiaticum]